MRTSARNQFSGKVTQLKRGAVNDEITLEVAAASHRRHRHARERDSLGLTGSEAFALVKSSSIILVTGDEARAVGPQPPGRHHHARRGGRGEHRGRDRAGGRRRDRRHRHRDSGEAMGAGGGQRGAAIFKASSVIIGTPA
jgi:molybdate transport system regulatory protein